VQYGAVSCDVVLDVCDSDRGRGGSVRCSASPRAAGVGRPSPARPRGPYHGRIV